MGGRIIFQIVKSILDFLFIALMLFLLIVAAYLKHDVDIVYKQADPVQYIQYKPTAEEDTPSFRALQKLNPDVKGWLTIYDTNIDYPLLHSLESNSVYLNRNPTGDVQSSGSLFIDYRNKPTFNDFNTIIHGHHMDRHEMFGDIGLFRSEKFFVNHQYGNLYYRGKNHGLEILAFLETSGYDWSVYAPAITGEEPRKEYINNLYSKATYIRGVKNLEAYDENFSGLDLITTADHIVLMSTCAMDTTNGRLILIAKILEEEVENPFPETIKKKSASSTDFLTDTESFAGIPLWLWDALLLVIIIVAAVLHKLSQRKGDDVCGEE